MSYEILKGLEPAEFYHWFGRISEIPRGSRKEAGIIAFLEDFAAKRDKKKLLPYFTQSGEDREKNGDQYLANMKDGAWAGIKYFAFDGTERRITVSIRGTAAGTVKVYTNRNMPPVASLLIRPSKDWTEYTGKLSVPVGTAPLVFLYEGPGSLDFLNFTIE